ncbi:redoxin domain-containing protein [Brevibacterium senegalense]|uniref:redoxin domain-containing protein n=1 Tax=Brevibacterium senegalense TaxID=1033736 RepID=UPI000363D6C9|nr:redoxin domain-containing protein [Brevibacterium senegalense]
MIPRVLPDLLLPAHTGEDLSIRPSGPDGRTLLVFVPHAFTPVCGSELRTLAELAPRLREGGTEPVVVSCDTKYTLRAWAQDQLGERWDVLPLLSDFWPHGDVSRQCGVFGDRHGGPRRIALLVAEEGAVVDEESTDIGRPRDLGRFLS